MAEITSVADASLPGTQPPATAVKRLPLRVRTAIAWTRACTHPALISWLAGILPGTRRPPANPGPFDPLQVRRIFVARTDGIGDFVLTLPLLTELRALFPEATILLGSTAINLTLLRGSKLADKFVPIDPGAKGMKGRVLRWFKWARIARTLRKEGEVDLAIFPRWDFDMHYMPAIGYLSGARWRVGYTENTRPAKAKEQRGYDSLLTHVHSLPCQHEARLNFEILGGLGIRRSLRTATLSLEVGETAAALRWIKDRGLESVRLIALMTGVSHPNRCWPLERYAEVIERVAGEFGVGFALVGGKQEAENARFLCARFPGICHDATSFGGLRETTALLSQCKLYLGNNTGPLHLAALMGVPAVYVSSHNHCGLPTDTCSEFRFSAFGVPFTSLQPLRPLDDCSGDCERPSAHCITQVTSDAVIEAVRQAFRGNFMNEALL